MTTLAEKWMAEGRAKARAEAEAEAKAEAKAEAEAEGRAEGKAKALRKILTLKFGPLSEAASARVTSASQADVDRWLELVLFAGTLEAVLDN